MKSRKAICLCFFIASSIVFADSNPFSENTVVVTENKKVKTVSETAKTDIKAGSNAKKQEKKEPSSQKTLEYRVVKGDYLMAISRKFYNGNSSHWVDIVEANKEKYPSLLSNPNLIYPGWVLTIPNTKSSSITDIASNTGTSYTSSDSNKVGSGNAPKYASNSSSNAPSLNYQKNPNASGINSKSPNFKVWLKTAIDTHGDWAMPSVTNKYGQTISVEMYMKGIMFIESSGTHRKSDGSLVRSHCGAQGFMQLMPATAKGLGVDGTDPAQNISGGCKLFKQIFTSKYVGQRSGVEKMVLAACAYNCGPWSKCVKGSWQDLKNSGSGVAGYGIKFKMCVGLELTADERTYVQNKMCYGGKTVDQYANECYANSQGLGL